MIQVINPQFKTTDTMHIIDTTSRSTDWSRGLSPFYCGPVNLYGGYRAYNVENAWQYSKVYYNHVDANDNPSSEYFQWADAGWRSIKANRYPMAKGTKPLYSFWDGAKLGYLEARQKIYIPLYSEAVKKTYAFKRLKEVYADAKFNAVETLYLKDFDAHNLPDDYDYTYSKLWNNPDIKVGHAYVLAMLLEGTL